MRSASFIRGMTGRRRIRSLTMRSKDSTGELGLGRFLTLQYYGGLHDYLILAILHFY